MIEYGVKLVPGSGVSGELTLPSRHHLDGLAHMLPPVALVGAVPTDLATSCCVWCVLWCVFKRGADCGEDDILPWRDLIDLRRTTFCMP